MKTATFLMYVCFLFITYASNVDKNILTYASQNERLVHAVPSQKRAEINK